jgi:hypothetical protein
MAIIGIPITVISIESKINCIGVIGIMFRLDGINMGIVLIKTSIGTMYKTDSSILNNAAVDPKMTRNVVFEQKTITRATRGPAN